MKVPISKRLLACCAFVHPGDRVADIGTDHGYLGIYLLTQGIAVHVLASDLREKPLERARANAARFGTVPQMDFYRTDGVRGLPRNFDVLVCAGMGADTIVEILNQAPWLRDGMHRLILQPQASGADLRAYLGRNGWRIIREQPVEESGFLYTVLEAEFGGGQPVPPGEQYVSLAMRESGHPLLPAYVRRCAAGARMALEGLAHAAVPQPEKKAYYEQVLEDLMKLEDSYGIGAGCS